MAESGRVGNIALPSGQARDKAAERFDISGEQARKMQASPPESRPKPLSQCRTNNLLIESQMFAKVSVYADQGISEILQELPTKEDVRTDTTSVTTGTEVEEVNSDTQEVAEAKAINDAGISNTQAGEFETKGQRLSTHRITHRLLGNAVTI